MIIFTAIALLLAIVFCIIEIKSGTTIFAALYGFSAGGLLVVLLVRLLLNSLQGT